VLSALRAAHANGQTRAGLDVETGQPRDLAPDGILDLYTTKWWALKLAADAAATVLRVDQIIMAKQAGGPKPRDPGAMDDE
jgi:T-complex protein 1 subunit theta